MPATATSTKPYPMRNAEEKRTAYLRRLTSMQETRSSWDAHWHDVGRHIIPRAMRWHTTDRNRGGQHKYGSILDNTTTWAARVLSAGMVAGLSPPSGRWFRLVPRDPELQDNHNVSLWLDKVRRAIEMVFTRSNVYRVFPRMYKEAGVFGTSAVLVLSDFENLIHLYPLTLGQYWLQQDYQGRVTTVYRRFQKTVGEVVKEFGYENCSHHVQQAFDNRTHEGEVELLHVIEPRADQERNLRSKAATDMPWRSIYFEVSGAGRSATSGGSHNKILREGGFKRMRVLAPRWEVEGDDVYGSNCPGMEALGDIHQLQHEQLRKSQAIDYKTLPPLQIPSSMRGREQDSLPGGRSYFEPGETVPFDQNTPSGGIRTAFDTNLEIPDLKEDIGDVQQRIQRMFYVDMFLLITTQDHTKTATEVAELVAEKMPMIGPVIERVTNELHLPLIELTLEEMLEVGALPPIPEELEGQELAIEMVSVLALAQRASGIGSTQQWMSEILAVGQTRADVLDNVDFDAWARRTAFMRGIDNELLVDQDNVDSLRATRAQAEAAREQMEMAKEQAGVVKDLSGPVEQNSALNELLRTASSYGVPQGV